ncbi:ATP-binding protein [Treponema parvum]|uniref:ATP-binding protein n=1 Tax=Treponema parvum TaxID=138851 RepID=A0A975F070_9SPIR|nr:ATP-binding protein [Treponema parvum]QTQ12017.1 ATP-binding protein [Treponema parvum]
MIIRENWLKKIRPFYENELVKALIGIRRCGKSVILRQIVNEIDADEAHKIFINFEDLQFNALKDELDLYKYVKNLINDDQKYYLFFDEIQNVANFEKAINSFRLLNTSIFITGSNTKLLSGELATLLSGRYVSFKILPFSFAEALEIQGIHEANDEVLMDYIRWGGMPQRFSIKNDEDIRVFLSDLYDSIVLKDVVSRYKIQNVALLNKIIDYLSINMSQIFSGTSIVNFLKAEKRDCSKESLYNYLSFITNSCIVNKVSRYDIHGKRILSTFEKYYLADVSLARIHSTKIDVGASLENIVYNELLNRGYEVHVGILKNTEIDFIAQKGNEKKYFQVCYLLANDKTIAREFGAYDSVKDNYPKYVLSLDKFDFSQNGIIHKNLIKWLSENSENSKTGGF